MNLNDYYQLPNNLNLDQFLVEFILHSFYYKVLDF